MKCLICDDDIKESWISLAQHVTRKHNITTEYYYINYMNGSVGVCMVCGKPTKFKNINKGYLPTCGSVCGGIYNRRQLREDKERFDLFREKVSQNQTDIWLNRTSEEKLTITNKIRETTLSVVENMSTEERRLRFGWMNRLTADEKKIKVDELLNKSLRKFWSNCTEEEKQKIHDRVKRTKLGDRYDIDIMSAFILYRNTVRNITDRTYRKNKHVINPLNLPIGRHRDQWQVDHKFSIIEGFYEKVPPKVMSSVCNLEVLSSTENNKKNRRCSITIEDLYRLYYEYNAPKTEP